MYRILSLNSLKTWNGNMIHHKTGNIQDDDSGENILEAEPMNIYDTNATETLQTKDEGIVSDHLSNPTYYNGLWSSTGHTNSLPTKRYRNETVCLIEYSMFR